MGKKKESKKKVVKAGKKVKKASKEKKKSRKFIARDLSWVDFNRRVLFESERVDNKIIERCKFLSITSSNLDEFITVRLAKARHKALNERKKKDKVSGINNRDLYHMIRKEVKSFIKDQYKSYYTIKNLLNKIDVDILSYNDLSREDKYKCDTYFCTISHKITPFTINKKGQFPLIRNEHLCIAVNVNSGKKKRLNIIDLSNIDKVFIIDDSNTGKIKIIDTADIIINNLDKLLDTKEYSHPTEFRIYRDANFIIDDSDPTQMLEIMTRKIKRREHGAPIHIRVQRHTNKKMKETLLKLFHLHDDEMISVDGPLDLTMLMDIYNIPSLDIFKEKSYKSGAMAPEFVGISNNGKSVFDIIKEGDVLLHHPYQSFEPVLKFIDEAANDSNVEFIGMTLYRVGHNSPLIKSLATAALNGKKVTVLMELKARFDEENNIKCAKYLESSGVHVIYGYPNLKVHSKIALVSRKEGDKTVNYVHLGTGNYNYKTTSLYVDYGLFTCDKAIGEDANIIFSMIALGKEDEDTNMKELVCSPSSIKSTVRKYIKKEIECTKNNKESGFIFMKMNSLQDKDIINDLYEASENGVKICLIVRGICCMYPNDNIAIKSMVGNFLEHHRIYYFKNSNKLYLSSADMMERNLERRIEIMFPINDNKVNTILTSMIIEMMKDVRNSYEMTPDGKYVKLAYGEGSLDCQKRFGDEAALAEDAATAVPAEITEFNPAEKAN